MLAKLCLCSRLSETGPIVCPHRLSGRAVRVRRDPGRPVRRRTSIDALLSSNVTQLTYPCHSGVARSAQLLNDALPLPRPDYFPSPPTPDSIGSPGSPPTSDLLRQALQLQLGSPPRFLGARELPTYTYQSPVSLEADGRPLDWKVSLFALHRTCYLQRNHPEQGFLHNNVVKQIVRSYFLISLSLGFPQPDLRRASCPDLLPLVSLQTSQAQLCIFQLLGPSERMDAFARTRRPASPSEEAELAELDDPRLMFCRDRVSKLSCLRVCQRAELPSLGV